MYSLRRSGASRFDCGRGCGDGGGAGLCRRAAGGADAALSVGGLGVSQALAITINVTAKTHWQYWIFRAGSFMMGRQYKGNSRATDAMEILSWFLLEALAAGRAAGAGGVVDVAASAERRRRTIRRASRGSNPPRSVQHARHRQREFRDRRRRTCVPSSATIW